MKFPTSLAAITLLICSTLIPLQAQANNYQMQQMLVMNNVSTEEQTISGQINAYMGSGQLTPAQGAAFSSELSQISSQAMMGSPQQTIIAMNELNSLSTQISSSLVVPAQYAVPYGGVPGYGAAPAYGGVPSYGAAQAYGGVPAYGDGPAYGAATNPGFYNNWRARDNAAYNEHLQAERQMQSQANTMHTDMVNRANYQNLVNRENANAAARGVPHNFEAHPRINAAPAPAARNTGAQATYERGRPPRH